jgi:Tol biopolymer transport system component
MIDEHQVREMLHRRANAVPTIVVDAPKAARRARRRLLANGAIAMLAAAAIAVATFAGVGAIRSAPVPADRPTPSPAPGVLRANGEVLNFTGRPGDLVAVNPQTGEERVLVEDLDVVYSAEWSADGRWVAYEAPGPEGIGLWVVNASQEPRQVAATAPDLGASIWKWSPTGAELAIQREEPPNSPDSDWTLSTIDPVTGETTDVFRSRPEEVGPVGEVPAWSPDGTRFVFGARGGALYSMGARTGELSLLVRLPGKNLDSVDQILWSPDGAHIAVMNDLVPGGGRLYVMDADGSNVRVLVDDFDPAGATWSPDGTRLAFAEGLRHGKVRIWVASMDGRAPAEIGSLSPACIYRCGHDLTWSPDGSRIALRSTGRESVDVSAIDADGQGEAERIDEITFRSWDGGSYTLG